MESSRRLGGPRALLPYEAELCNVIGASKEEYLEFLDLVQAKVEGRKEGYELIPDIRCDPVSFLGVTLYTGSALTAAGQIVVSLALAAISYALTPKPKTPDGGGNLKLGDIQGKSRFAPQSSFDSVQDLAILGSFIPLVYAAKGVRVNSQLLWSQIKTTGVGQIISVITLFSNGEIGAEPDYESFALGTTLLDSISPYKIALYFNTGSASTINNRLINTNKYSQSLAPETNDLGNRDGRDYDSGDPFSVKIYPNQNFKPYSSSTRTSTTKAEFGSYRSLPNGNAYKVPWELIQFMKDGDDKAKADLRIKLQKINHTYPQLCHLKQSPQVAPLGVFREVSKDETFYYTLSSYDAVFQQETAQGNAKYNKFSPWGSVDAKNSIDGIREMVDDNISVGDQYLVGSAIVVCTNVDNGDRWQDNDVTGGYSFDKSWTFKVEEPGWVMFTDREASAQPYASANIQRLAIASLNNTKTVDITEIGIKSKVFKRINGFPNVNALPSRERVEYYESKNTGVQTGSISTYTNRISLFKLEARPVNSNIEYQNILKGDVLAVKGNSPISQYNTIAIDSSDHPFKYEYRFVPVSNNIALHGPSYGVNDIYVLDHAAQLISKNKKFTNVGLENAPDNLTINIYFHAKKFSLPDVSNPQNVNTDNKYWTLGALGINPETGEEEEPVLPTGAAVTALNKYEEGTMPTDAADWQDFQPLWQFNDYIVEVVSGVLNGGSNDAGVFYGITPTVAGGAYVSRFPTDSPELWDDVYTSSTGETGPLLGPTVGVLQRKNPNNPAEDEYVFYLPEGWKQEDEDTISISVSSGSTNIHSYYTRPVINPQKGNLQFRYKVVKASETINSSHVNDKTPPEGRWEVFLYPKGTSGLRRATHAFKAQVNLGATVTTSDPIVYNSYGESNGQIRNFTSGSNGSGLEFEIIKTFTGAENNPDQVHYSWKLTNAGSGYFTGEKVELIGLGIDPIEVVAGERPALEEKELDDFHSSWTGTDVEASNRYWSNKNLNPHHVMSDHYLYDAEASSNDDAPEHSICFVNEIVNTNSEITYRNLATAGIRINSTKEFTAFSQLSAFIKQGIKVAQLIDDYGNPTNTTAKKSSNNFVEIVYDLLTNKSYGAGDLVGVSGVNKEYMQEAAKYCHANEFTWDGIVDSNTNLREFIFTHAGYNLLDFTIIGGLFALRPSFPTDESGKINIEATVPPFNSSPADQNGKIEIKALYTDGNMRNLQVSFLTPEERQMFKATVLYRKQEINGFPETKVTTIAMVDGNQNSIESLEALPEEVFDLSGWCTSVDHAKRFAAIALASRKKIDHGIVFETTPTSVLGLLGGDYIRVISENTHSSRFNNGSIDADGFVTSRTPISGTINIYCWTPGTLGNIKTTETLTVGADGKATTGLRNVLFAQVDTTEENRIYKVNSITYGEEGFVSVGAAHVPLTNSNKLDVLANTDPTKASFSSTFFTLT